MILFPIAIVNNTKSTLMISSNKFYRFSFGSELFFVRFHISFHLKLLKKKTVEISIDLFIGREPVKWHCNYQLVTFKFITFFQPRKFSDRSRCVFLVRLFAVLRFCCAFHAKKLPFKNHLSICDQLQVLPQTGKHENHPERQRERVSEKLVVIHTVMVWHLKQMKFNILKLIAYNCKSPKNGTPNTNALTANSIFWCASLPQVQQFSIFERNIDQEHSNNKNEKCEEKQEKKTENKWTNNLYSGLVRLSIFWTLTIIFHFPHHSLGFRQTHFKSHPFCLAYCASHSTSLQRQAKNPAEKNVE